MNIDRVTITGADDSVKPSDLLTLSKRYPFVEWGILLSKSSMGRPRFPSKAWLDQLLERSHGLSLSGHICGRWVRDMLAGGDELKNEIGSYLPMFQRIQWNFHAEHLHLTIASVMSGIKAYHDKQNILQMDGVNDALMMVLRANGVNVVPLFDTSGGAGIVPDKWPAVMPGIYCGYAGGLGPNTLGNELLRIEHVAGDATIWIDMERMVRSSDDQQFDLEKVEHCLKMVDR